MRFYGLILVDRLIAICSCIPNARCLSHREEQVVWITLMQSIPEFFVFDCEQINIRTSYYFSLTPSYFRGSCRWCRGYGSYTTFKRPLCWVLSVSLIKPLKLVVAMLQTFLREYLFYCCILVRRQEGPMGITCAIRWHILVWIALSVK